MSNFKTVNTSQRDRFPGKEFFSHRVSQNATGPAGAFFWSPWEPCRHFVPWEWRAFSLSSFLRFHRKCYTSISPSVNNNLSQDSFRRAQVTWACQTIEYFSCCDWKVKLQVWLDPGATTLLAGFSFDFFCLDSIFRQFGLSLWWWDGFQQSILSGIVGKRFSLCTNT